MTEQTGIDANAKKSPLKARPLRDAGESGMERLYEGVYGGIGLWLFVCVLMLAMALTEWLHWWQRTPPQPLLVSAVAVAVCGFAAWRIRRKT